MAVIHPFMHVPTFLAKVLEEVEVDQTTWEAIADEMGLTPQDLEDLVVWCQSKHKDTHRFCCFMRRAFAHDVEEWGVFNPYADGEAFPEEWKEPADAIRDGWEPYSHSNSSLEDPPCVIERVFLRRPC